MFLFKLSVFDWCLVKIGSFEHIYAKVRKLSLALGPCALLPEVLAIKLCELDDGFFGILSDH